MVAQDLRDAEVGCSETREGAVTAAVVLVRGGILRRVETVEDTHTDVAHGNGAPLALFEFERHQLLRSINLLDDTAPGSAPIIAYGYFNPVVVQFRNRKASPNHKILEFSESIRSYPATSPRHASGKIRGSKAADHRLELHLIGLTQRLIQIIIERMSIPLFRIAGIIGISCFDLLEEVWYSIRIVGCVLRFERQIPILFGEIFQKFIIGMRVGIRICRTDFRVLRTRNDNTAACFTSRPPLAARGGRDEPLYDIEFIFHILFLHMNPELFPPS